MLYVGGVLNRSEFFTVGPALTNALSSEEHATAGGQIIVSETAFKFVKICDKDLSFFEKKSKLN